MRDFLRFLLLGLTASMAWGSACAAALPVDSPGPENIVFATFAEDEGQLLEAAILAESLRSFGGSLRGAPLWVYVPEKLPASAPDPILRLRSFGARIGTSSAPAEGLEYFYGSKVFGAAKAEADAEGKAGILAWLDCDTVIGREPREFLLAGGTVLGYRPVQHDIAGSRFPAPADPLWSRIYETLAIPSEALFPMVTYVDGHAIRPYFNAGLLVVRPERGILRAWPDNFRKLYREPFFRKQCEAEKRVWIFLHQMALTGAVLNLAGRTEMIELSPLYNYPLNLQEQIPPERRLESLDGVVTLRYDSRSRAGELKKTTPRGKIFDWLKERI